MEKSKLHLIDFYAEWCGPCKFVTKIVDKIADELREIKVERINVDQHRNLIKTLNITSVPTLILYKNNQELGRKEGFIFKEALIEWINSYL
ncbi:MAG TPA: thioredoxin domain-containing protein [Bacilli bacterium]|nr:MAG: Thioredoxin-1 [Tenericutes bacterium ADurb.BinA124]HNZ50760.1 thioredoxin domain-containing protein [Bacilli bacterium]HPN61227.1 thioredoxin domain-containing protein [Bacilli bacterium]HPX84572.1 thioredoxin domain-containing protein [Bacilli bacterium]HQC74636.1 thioredoxin domain-containing protein [Bacilli bacterium]